MAKKKKPEKKVEYIPSEYQKNLFDFVMHGQGNAVIEAEPGSGKSFSAIWCLKYMPEGSKVLFTAFNGDIVSELEKKIKKEKLTHDMTCKTMHSIGYGMLMANFGSHISRKPNEFKYFSYIYNNIHQLAGHDYSVLDKKDRTKYLENLKKYVDFGRNYLVETVKEMDYIESHYSIPTISNEKEIALKVMDWGKNNYDTVDFTDMVWLPNVLNCKPYNRIYDWIIVDEAQDLSKAERELVLRCTKMSTRILFFGQDIQCLYGFQGADYQSFNELKKIPNTIQLPLSISYRCPKNIVKLANKFSPKMEAAPDAIDGEVKYNVPIDEIADGDMVLCRVNAPLLQLYCELVKSGKTPHILGKDIGSGLVKMIEKTKEEKLSVNLTEKGVFPALYNKLFDNIDSVMRRNKISFEMSLDDMNIAQELDTIMALEAISSECSDATCLVDTIKKLFSNKKAKGVTLSTIHKAKGLEVDNVFICCPSLLPAKSAREEWEKQQEANLEFVAYTRAKKKLCFLNEDNFKVQGTNNTQKINELNKKKIAIFSLYGGIDRCQPVIPNSDAAKEIIENSSKIQVQPKKLVDVNTLTQTDSVMSTIKIKRKVKKKK